MPKKRSGTELRTVKLSAADILQAIDGLRSRAEAYERTADLLEGKPAKEVFLAEECSDAGEAREIARHFRDIVAVLETSLS